MAGSCDPRFAAVEAAFEDNLAAGQEVGAACAVAVDGRVVVDLWGGTRRRDGTPWEEGTLVDCRSASKALTALCLHVLVDRGAVDLDLPLRRHWPELRADPTVRQALSHQAGIPVLDDLPPGAILDWEVVAAAVERQEPIWMPGERHGYHGVSFGWLAGEPVRRLSGASLPSFLRREVVGRLGLDCFMGTPADEHARVADLVAGPVAHQELAPPPRQATGSTTPGGARGPSLADRMYAPVLPPAAPSMNDPRFRAAAIPVTGVTTTARSLAALYGELALDGGRLLSPRTVRAAAEEQVSGVDAVLGVPVRRALGFELTPPWADDGRSPECFGHPGGGGVVAFADPEAGVGFAYLNNAIWSGAPGADPRAGALVRTLYASL